MKVSRSSWHYRLYRYVHNTSRGPAFLNPFTNRERCEAELPKSLCPYAWSIFLGLLGSVFLFAVLAAFSWLFLAVYLWPFVATRIDGAWRLTLPSANGNGVRILTAADVAKLPC